MAIPVVLNVTVCIPAKNELANLETLLHEVDAALSHQVVGESRVVVFDDGSSDGTFEYLRDIRFANFEIQVLRSLVSVGKSAALHNAFEEALATDTDVIVMMDGDCQDDPAYLPQFLEELSKGHDVVNGRRVNREHSRGKKLSSRAFNAAVRQVSGLELWDVNSGYKAFSRSAAQSLRPYLYGELHRVLLVIAVWLGLEVGEVKVVNRPRKTGLSRYGVARGWRGLFDLLTIQFLRRYHARPGHFFSGIGVSLVLLGTAYFLAHILISGNTVSWQESSLAHWLTFGAVTLGSLFVSMGFLAELIVFSSKSPPTSVLRSLDSYPNLPPVIAFRSRHSGSDDGRRTSPDQSLAD